MGRASLENGKELGQWTEFNAKFNLIKKKKKRQLSDFLKEERKLTRHPVGKNKTLVTNTKHMSLSESYGFLIS